MEVSVTKVLFRGFSLWRPFCVVTVDLAKSALASNVVIIVHTRTGNSILCLCGGAIGILDGQNVWMINTMDTPLPCYFFFYLSSFTLLHWLVSCSSELLAESDVVWQVGALARPTQSQDPRRTEIAKRAKPKNQ